MQCVRGQAWHEQEIKPRSFASRKRRDLNFVFSTLSLSLSITPPLSHDACCYSHVMPCHVRYYETIAGGAGAGPTWPGCSGVHTHMTNTRITDPEILERRYFYFYFYMYYHIDIFAVDGCV